MGAAAAAYRERKEAIRDAELTAFRLTSALRRLIGAPGYGATSSLLAGYAALCGCGVAEATAAGCAVATGLPSPAASDDAALLQRERVRAAAVLSYRTRRSALRAVVAAANTPFEGYVLPQTRGPTIWAFITP